MGGTGNGVALLHGLLKTWPCALRKGFTLFQNLFYWWMNRAFGPLCEHTKIQEAYDMTKLTIVAFDGQRYDLEAADGSTVMENAVRNSVPGIEAECGGACACATCHVYVDDAWTAKVGEPEPMEEDMLDFAFDVRPTSRLSCQIKMSADLDGLVVHLPERQG